MFLPILFQQPDIQRLNQLVHDKDLPALMQLLSSTPPHNPFNVLKTGGAYAAGQRGWMVKPLDTPDGDHYVVFSTPIIAEDMGELLFHVERDGKLTYVPETDNMGVQLDKHNFDVRFDLPNHELIATDQIDCHWTGQPRSSFIFRISPTYTITKLTDRAGKPVRFSQAGGIVAVSPGKNSLKFNVAYSGTNLMPGFDRLFSDKEATLSGSIWYLTIAREPAPYDITMHAPKDWTEIAQGDQVYSKIVGDDHIMKFHMPVPVVWYSASEGPYKTGVTVIDGREYATMSQTMTDAQMAIQNALNSQVVEFYSKNFVRYPFKRWTALDSWQFHGGPGALEAYSFATYPGGLPDEDAHEPSHTWWAGILDNDYLQSLWNESFANFCMGLFARNRPGANKDEMARAFVSPPFASPIYKAAPLSDSGDPIGPAAAALGYGKGADVMQMLEDEIGTDTMIKCMSTWIKTNPPRHIGRWEDFEKVVDKVTGQDYTWFFDEWVRKSGYPAIDLESASWADGKLKGVISSDALPYRLDMDVLIRMADGTDKYSRITFTPVEGKSEFSIDCSQKPTLVSVDPWGKMLLPRGQDELRETLRGDLFEMKRYTDPAHKDWLSNLGAGESLDALPNDLSGVFVVGSPATVPAMAPLCDQVGFKVSANKLTYDGTAIDLDHGGAVALIDLPGGKTCMIGLGTSVLRPQLGSSRLCVFDEYGRPIRAKTDPITSGPLTYKLAP